MRLGEVLDEEPKLAVEVSESDTTSEATTIPQEIEMFPVYHKVDPVEPPEEEITDHQSQLSTLPLNQSTSSAEQTTLPIERSDRALTGPVDESGSPTRSSGPKKEELEADNAEGASCSGPRQSSPTNSNVPPPAFVSPPTTISVPSTPENRGPLPRSIPTAPKGREKAPRARVRGRLCQQERRPDTAPVVGVKSPEKAVQHHCTSNFTPVLLVLTSMFFQSNANFNFVNPIVWRPSDRDVTSIEGEIVARLYIKSACETVSKKLTLQGQKLKTFDTWCDQQFEDSIMTHIRKNCGYQVAPLRRKRVAIMLILGLVATLLAGFAAIGLSIYNTAQISNLKATLEQLKTDQKLAQEAINSLERRVNDIIERVNNQTLKWEEYERWAFIAQLATATLASKFEVTQIQLIDIFESWKEKKISTQLFTLFNITQEDVNLYPRRLMTPLRCQYNPYENFIDLWIHGHKLNPNFTIMQADPFYMKVNNHSCLFYEGPKSVLYDLRTNQVCEAYDYAHTGPLQLHPDFKCKPKAPADKNYWTTRPCPILNKDQSTLQVKVSQQNRFVYCQGHKIYLNNKPHPCPDYVFLHSLNLPLIIDNYTFPYFTSRHSKSSIIDSKHFDWIDQNVFAGVEHAALLPKLDVTKFNSSEEEKKQSPSSIFTILFFALLLLIILYGTFRLYKFYRKATQRTQRSTQHTELVELDETPMGQPQVASLNAPVLKGSLIPTQSTNHTN